MRFTASVAAAGVVAAIGAVVLGEYEFGGASVVLSGLILGLFVSEVVVSVGSAPGRRAAMAAAAVTIAGLVGAAWISTARDLALVPAEGWAAVAVGAVTAALRAWWPARAGGSRPEPSQTE